MRKISITEMPPKEIFIYALLMCVCMPACLYSINTRTCLGYSEQVHKLTTYTKHTNVATP